MTNQCQKGKRGEREFAIYLRGKGYEEAARGQQHKGGGDSPDVVGVPGWHIERKRTGKLRLYAALDQARSDAAGSGNMPVVAHRCDGDNRVLKFEGVSVPASKNCEIAILLMDDLIELYGFAMSHGYERF